MKISNKIIEWVVSEVAGPDVIPLITLIKNKKNVSEFKIAEDLEIEINTTRNMLYRLYNFNLVSFTRKKDKVKGWYIYYWTFNQKRIKQLVLDLKKDRLEKLGERLMREKQNQFFTCDENCMRLDFEAATNFNFKCPECGDLMQIEDNREIIKKIEEEMKNIEKEIEGPSQKAKKAKKKKNEEKENKTATKKTVKKKSTVPKPKPKKTKTTTKTTKKTTKKSGVKKENKPETKKTVKKKKKTNTKNTKTATTNSTTKKTATKSTQKKKNSAFKRIVAKVTKRK